jgi:6-pyruvoyltetrahydropterin/6-carboxytetrahydropterin synthase
MKSSPYLLSIQKETFKFSSAHMAVFADGTKEPLHGHNYFTHISFQLKEASFQNFVPFSYFKELINQLCQEWDSKVLIAANCPYLEKRVSTVAETEFVLCGKRYVIPSDEILFLELENVTVELLAALFCKKLVAAIRSDLLSTMITGIQVQIEETPGQSSTFLQDC